MNGKDRIIFALDVPSTTVADNLTSLLGDHVGTFKVGLELFMAGGPSVLRSIQRPVMLDLKLHDIPETVERAVQRAGDLGVRFLTLHVQQRETLQRAVKAADKGGVQLLGVTVLTSMTDRDGLDLRWIECQAITRVPCLAKLAWEEGITGFVCSPKEAHTIRTLFPQAVIVVPGIRPMGADEGDQKRTGTPAQAARDGADYLVVGRPIRDAADPVQAAQAIAREIETAL